MEDPTAVGLIQETVTWNKTVSTKICLTRRSVMRKARLTVTVCVTLLWAGTTLWVAPARALTKCTAAIRPTDGTILVGAKSVSGTLLWGNSAGTETNAFNNAATCVKGSPLVAKKCQLGASGSALAMPGGSSVWWASGMTSTTRRSCRSVGDRREDTHLFGMGV